MQETPSDGLKIKDRAEIGSLAARAEPLVSRRSMFVDTGRRLVLPVLVTFFVSKEAMAAGGSGLLIGGE